MGDVRASNLEPVGVVSPEAEEKHKVSMRNVCVFEVIGYGECQANIPRHPWESVNDFCDFVDTQARAAWQCVDGSEVDAYPWRWAVW